MAATHGLAAILRDAHIGSANAPSICAPQDEAGKFEAIGFMESIH
jgi:hypothetical protein